MSKTYKFLMQHIHDLLFLTGIGMFVGTMFAVNLYVGWVVLSLALMFAGITLAKLK